jgi:surfeit locus 1 family protein
MRKATPPKAALLWPTLLTLVMLAVLVGLGIWQLQRLAWKEALLAKLEQRLDTPKQALPQTLPSKQALERAFAGAAAKTLAPALKARLEAWQFRQVDIACQPMPKQLQIAAGRRLDNAPSWAFIVPCLPASGAPVLVDLGSNSAAYTDLTLPSTSAVPSHFVGRTKPADVFLKNLPEDFEIVPLVVVAQTPWPGLTPSLQPGVEAIPNNHLSYALTWFGLALTLAAVYGVYAYRLYKRR